MVARWLFALFCASRSILSPGRAIEELPSSFRATFRHHYQDSGLPGHADNVPAVLKNHQQCKPLQEERGKCGEGQPPSTNKEAWQVQECFSRKKKRERPQTDLNEHNGESPPEGDPALTVGYVLCSEFRIRCAPEHQRDDSTCD
jgi:hypothetical protein